MSGYSEHIANTPEVNLWRAVFNQAIKDAMWKRIHRIYYKEDQIVASEYIWHRDEKAVKYLMKHDEKNFNSAINLCELLGRNLTKIRYILGLSPEEAYGEKSHIIMLTQRFRWNGTEFKLVTKRNYKCW